MGKVTTLFKGMANDKNSEQKKHNINIISIVSPTFKVNGKRVAAVRIQTHDYDNLVKELKGKGYDVLSINKWSPK